MTSLDPVADAADPAHGGASVQVRVIGTGLIGTSLGLALTAAGVPVTLEDPDPRAVGWAARSGAGEAAGEESPAPGLVVVAAPPDAAAAVVAQALRRWPDAVVTDVTSVKQAVLDQVTSALGADHVALARYVGGHPMAGRERGGAVSAQRDLFVGRPYVVCPHPLVAAPAQDLVLWLARTVGGAVVVLSPTEHDLAVAAVSHAPQVASSLMAARLCELPEWAVGLAGQGLRDVTRIAASDPVLWTQILAGNAAPVARVLEELHHDLGRVVQALRGICAAPATPGSPGTVGEGRGVLAETIAAGQQGRARIPGKHGAAATPYGVVTVLVPDTPGMIGRVLTHVGEAGVNLEDLRLEHGVGAQMGVLELMVVPTAVAPLATALSGHGWTVHETP